MNNTLIFIGATNAICYLNAGAFAEFNFDFQYLLSIHTLRHGLADGLGGNVQFYPVNALAEAGAHVDTIANWHSNVIVDRELITAQQPMSAPEFGDVLVKQLNVRRN